MKSKKKLLEKSQLYLILDRQTLGKRPISSVAKKIRNCSVDIIQLRDKTARKDLILKDAFVLRRFFLSSESLFIINDHLDIAKIADADGVHLGQDDVSLEIARKVLGANKIIGISCHNIEQAVTAQKNGADYIGVGPLFATPIKLDDRPLGLSLIKEFNKKIKIPYFMIGGIDHSNVEAVLAHGAKRVAVCRAIMDAGDMRLAVNVFREKLVDR